MPDVNESSEDERDPLLDEVDVLVYRAASDDYPAAMGVRLVHRATGIVVESVTEPTQVANRDIALRLLRERLADHSRPRGLDPRAHCQRDGP
jgi:protein subunit release factor A